MPNKTYIVELKSEERNQLKQLIIDSSLDKGTYIKS